MNGGGMNAYWNKVDLERKMGSPSVWWYHTKLYGRQDLEMCENFVSFG